MKRFLTTVTVTALSALLTLTSFDPAAAAPIQPPIQPAIQQTENQPAGLIEVQYRHHNRNFRRHHRPHYRPHYRNHHRGGYWHGHRGYRYHRPGYRRHDGWWYPMAAFTAGAIIGGAVSQPPRGSAHVRWCASRYKTYRASDNTYQPTNGPRRQCVVR